MMFWQLALLMPAIVMAGTNQGDAAALCDLFYATGGTTSWINKAGWEAGCASPTPNPCDEAWDCGCGHDADNPSDCENFNLSPHTSCDCSGEHGDADRRVLGISLGENGLTGTLPLNSWTSLTELTHLILDDSPGLTGSIPASMGNMTKIRYFVLHKCSFSGNLPSSLFSKWTKGFFIRIDRNAFTGPIPDMSAMVQLITFYGSDNLFTGLLPKTPNENGQTKGWYWANNNLIIPNPLPEDYSLQTPSSSDFGCTLRGNTKALRVDSSCDNVATASKTRCAPYTDLNVDHNCNLNFDPHVPDPATVSGITKADPAVVSTTHSSAKNNFLNGDKVYFTNVAGMAEINSVECIVSLRTDQESFTCSNIDSGSFGTWDAGTSFGYGSNRYHAYTLRFEPTYVQDCIQGQKLTAQPAPGGFGQWASCSSCPPGETSVFPFESCFTACGDGLILQSGQCVPCEAGTFKKSGATCEACHANSSSTSGSNQCLCNAGYMSTSAGVCTKCGGNMAKTTVGNHVCHACEANTYKASAAVCAVCPYQKSSTAGSVGENSCQCSAGTMGSRGLQECTKCEGGHYSRQDSQVCEACEAGKETRKETGSAIDLCPTEVCFPCAPGSVSEAGSSWCEECVAGRWGVGCFPCGAPSMHRSSFHFQNLSHATPCHECLPGTTCSNWMLESVSEGFWHPEILSQGVQRLRAIGDNCVRTQYSNASEHNMSVEPIPLVNQFGGSCMEVFRCSMHGCLQCNESEASCPCRDGYTGPACGVCNATFYRLGDDCVRCPPGWAIAVVWTASFLMILAVLYILFTSDAKESFFLIKFKIFIGYAQVVTKLGQNMPQVPFPDDITSILGFWTLLELDINVIGPVPLFACVGGSGGDAISIVSRYTLITLLPVFLILAIVLNVFRRLANVSLKTRAFSLLADEAVRRKSDEFLVKHGAANFKSDKTILESASTVDIPGTASAAFETELEEVFEYLDISGDGLLDIDELVLTMDLLELPIKRGKLAEILAKQNCYDLTKDAFVKTITPLVVEHRDRNHPLLAIGSRTWAWKERTQIVGRGYKNALLVLYLTLAPICSTLINAYLYEPTGTNGAPAPINGSLYLRRDFRVEVNSPQHVELQALAIAGLSFYAGLVPGLLFGLLWYNKKQLDAIHVFSKYGFLILPYKHDYFFFDVIDIYRRLILGTFLVLILPGQIEQVVIAFLISSTFFIVHVSASPFKSQLDNHLMGFTHGTICMTLFFAILYSVKPENLEVWSTILIAMNGLLILALIIMVCVLTRKLCQLSGKIVTSLKSRSSRIRRSSMMATSDQDIAVIRRASVIRRSSVAAGSGPSHISQESRLQQMAGKGELAPLSDTDSA